MDELTKLANYHHSDKGTTADSKHGFTIAYERYFWPLKNEKIRILEVGVYNGGSLRMYNDYFPNAEIHGIDIVPKPQFDTPRITTHVVDQSNKGSLEHFVNQHKDLAFDIIIDDGSHHMYDQQVTFFYLSELLKPGGIFIIEDIHTSMGKNGTMLYGKPLEIFNSGINTTYNFLTNRPFSSVYLKEYQNDWLNLVYGECEIVQIANPNVPDAFGGMSVTAILKKIN